jgi:hypothetical protein
VDAAPGWVISISDWWFHQLEEFFAPNGCHSIGLQSPHIEEMARLTICKFWIFHGLNPFYILLKSSA